MSVKSFISAESHLNKLGVTLKQAKDYIESNLDHPDIIFNTARDYGVTSNMLSELSGYSRSAILDYFDAAGLRGKEVDYTSNLINSDLGPLEHLVGFNKNTGILSTDSLRATVKSLPGASSIEKQVQYDSFFKPYYPDFETKDGIFDAEELGVGNLSNVPATTESLESLFYGSLIGMFLALDQSELNQIKAFPSNGNPKEFQALLFNALDETPVPIAWNDLKLADLVVYETDHIIDKYWNSGSELVGLLDHSFLGLGIA